MASPILFSPFRLRELELSNRIVVSPMAQYSAADGYVTDWHFMHLGNLSVSGAGLLILEATAVEPRGRVSPYCHGLWKDEQTGPLSRITEFCQRHGGARLGLQLAHSGRKGSASAPWQGQAEVDAAAGGWQTVSPSSIPYPGRSAPHALSLAELDWMKEQFVATARRALRIGFDLLEIHGAHGYLLHSFLSPLSNDRTDRYGGSLENRMRFPLEVFTAVRAAWPHDRPLGYRISATDWVDSGGWTIEDSVVFSRALRAAGCDYVTASSGGSSNEQNIPVGPGYQLPFAERIRKEADIPTMGVGLITEPEQAEQALADGRADLLALGRAMMYQPRWAWQAAERLGADAYFPPQYARSHPSMRKRDFLKATR